MSPVEVENCLLTHARVRECAVVGVEIEGLTLTCAFIVVTDGGVDGLDLELQEFVKRALAPHKYPRLVRFLAEMPRNDRGKAARADLRKLL